MGLFRDRRIDPAYSARFANGAMTGAMIAVTGAMTATMTAVTGTMTATTAVADPGCCGDSSMRARTSKPVAPSRLSRAMRARADR